MKYYMATVEFLFELMLTLCVETIDFFGGFKNSAFGMFMVVLAAMFFIGPLILLLAMSVPYSYKEWKYLLFEREEDPRGNK